MSDHTVAAYDKELATLSQNILEMGGIAEKMLIDAMDALVSMNIERAKAVVASDPRLDALQRQVEEFAILTIARRQPMAVDLREIGEKLFISPKTVDTYRARIMEKLGLNHRSELVRFALYGAFNPVACAVVVGTGIVFFVLAVAAYDPGRGLIARRGGPAGEAG